RAHHQLPQFRAEGGMLRIDAKMHPLEHISGAARVDDDNSVAASLEPCADGRVDLQLAPTWPKDILSANERRPTVPERDAICIGVPCGEIDDIAPLVLDSDDDGALAVARIANAALELETTAGQQHDVVRLKAAVGIPGFAGNGLSGNTCRLQAVNEDAV